MLHVQIDDEFKTTVAEAVRDALAELAPSGGSWRERIWTCPPETRLTVTDVAECLARTKAFVYRHTRNRTIKCRRLDGELVFRAADVRDFIREREEAA